MNWRSYLDHYPRLRKLFVLIIGLTVLGIGGIMLVLPGPAILVIPLGLAILATEFAWARSILKKSKEKLTRKKTSP